MSLATGRVLLTHIQYVSSNRRECSISKVPQCSLNICPRFKRKLQGFSCIPANLRNNGEKGMTLPYRRVVTDVRRQSDVLAVSGLCYSAMALVLFLHLLGEIGKEREEIQGRSYGRVGREEWEANGGESI